MKSRHSHRRHHQHQHHNSVCVYYTLFHLLYPFTCKARQSKAKQSISGVYGYVHDMCVLCCVCMAMSAAWQASRHAQWIHSYTCTSLYVVKNKKLSHAVALVYAKQSHWANKIERKKNRTAMWKVDARVWESRVSIMYATLSCLCLCVCVVCSSCVN